MRDRAVFTFFPPGGRKQVNMHMHYEDMREAYCPVRTNTQGRTTIASTTPSGSTAMYGQPGLPWFEFRVERQLRELKDEFDPGNAAHTIKVQLATRGAAQKLWQQIIAPGLIPFRHLHPQCARHIATKRHNLSSSRAAPDIAGASQREHTAPGISPILHSAASGAKEVPPSIMATQPSTRAALHAPRASVKHTRLRSFRAASAAAAAPRGQHGYKPHPGAAAARAANVLPGTARRRPRTVGDVLKQLSV